MVQVWYLFGSTFNEGKRLANKPLQSASLGSKKREHGSLLSFLSNDTQNNLISIINQQINADCAAWALVVDTTPDIAHHEQVSLHSSS